MSEIMYVLKALRQYQKANSTTDIAVSADSLANSIEALLRKVAERDVEVAEAVDLYFNGETEKVDNLIAEYMTY